MVAGSRSISAHSSLGFRRISLARSTRPLDPAGVGAVGGVGSTVGVLLFGVSSIAPFPLIERPSEACSATNLKQVGGAEKFAEPGWEVVRELGSGGLGRLPALHQRLDSR